MHINSGYTPGLIGSIAALHARNYSASHDFGLLFEAKVASELAAFAKRLENPKNQLWHVEHDGGLAATISIDGEDLGGNRAHLRWFIVKESLRGSGMGRKLLNTALEFCDLQGFDETVLWTLKGLEAARRLYEVTGFRLAEEYEGDQWGKRVIEQRFVRQAGSK